MHKRPCFFLFWTLSSSLINCLCGELFILSASGGLCFDLQWKVVRKFCPLCYKQVIALSPRIIKDKFSLVFSKLSQIALVATRLGQFCDNFENTRENLSLILLDLMRLHIQITVDEDLHISFERQPFFCYNKQVFMISQKLTILAQVLFVPLPNKWLQTHITNSFWKQSTGK